MHTLLICHSELGAYEVCDTARTWDVRPVQHSILPLPHPTGRRCVPYALVEHSLLSCSMATAPFEGGAQTTGSGARPKQDFQRASSRASRAIRPMADTYRRADAVLVFLDVKGVPRGERAVDCHVWLDGACVDGAGGSPHPEAIP